MIFDYEDREAIRVLGLWTTLWYKTGYRPFMRLVHRFNWHHATVLNPLPDGSVQQWCQWCGMRDTGFPIDYAKRLHVSEQENGD